MIQCDQCQDWFHEGTCVSVRGVHGAFVCPRCRAIPADTHAHNDGDWRMSNTLIYMNLGERFAYVKVDLPECSNLIELFLLPRGHVAFSENKKSRGVRAKANIPADTFVGCYAGIVQFACDPQSEYCFSASEDPEAAEGPVIDAKMHGNMLRFLNHNNSRPNVAACSINGVIHFSTICDIDQGEELTFDYGKYFWFKK